MRYKKFGSVFIFLCFVCGCTLQKIHLDDMSAVMPCESDGRYQIIDGPNVGAVYQKVSDSGEEVLLVRMHVRNTDGAKMLGVSFMDKNGLFEVPVTALDSGSAESEELAPSKDYLFYEMWISPASFDGSFCMAASYEKDLIDNGTKRGYVFSEVIPLDFFHIKESGD